MADGPVIQHSSGTALKNGMSQKVLFEQLKDVRKVTDMPLILMGYINTAMQFGFENLCKKAVEVGIDGFIIPDIPLDIYKEEYAPYRKNYDLRFILLVTPETPEARVHGLTKPAPVSYIWYRRPQPLEHNRASTTRSRLTSRKLRICT